MFVLSLDYVIYPGSPLPLNMLLVTVAIVLHAAYYLMLEKLFSRTVGKWLVGISLIAATGGKPSFNQVFMRMAFRYLPIAFLPILFGKGLLGFHDIQSGTRVIKGASCQKTQTIVADGDLR